MEAPRLTPEAILDVEFREKLRGYNPEDVDRYLEQLAAGVRELNAQLAAADQRAAASEARAGAADPESAAARTLVLAQRTADAAIEEARTEAERIVGDALRDVNERRAHAERETGAEIARLFALREQLSGEVEALQSWLAGEREKLRATLAATLEQLDAVGPALSPAPELQPVELPSFAAESPVAEAETDVEVDLVEVEADVDSAGDEGDAFIAELRRAVIDDRPLGPREDDLVPGSDDPFEEFIRYAGDVDEPRGLTSRLRRRR